MRIASLTAAALLVAAGGYAQDEPARRAATEVAARVPLEGAIKGAAYSAETLVEGSQQLADGNRIVRKTTGRVYRDGEGRTRREEDRPDRATAISITDPVAGYSYSLDAVNKVAWRTPMGTAGTILRKLEATQVEERRKAEVESAAAARSGGTVGFVSVPAASGQATSVRRVYTESGPDGQPPAAAGAGVARGGGAGGRGGVFARSAMPASATAGPLEHKTIEGVAVEGRKTTTVLPAGQVGNEQPITITSEQWRSPDLNVLVMTRHSDPRTGESTYRLLNIVRAEPDRSLFMVPADYTIKDTGIRKMLEASRKDQ